MSKLLFILILLCFFENVVARESAVEVSKKENVIVKISNSKICYVPIAKSNEKPINSFSFRHFKECSDAGGMLPVR